MKRLIDLLSFLLVEIGPIPNNTSGLAVLNQDHSMLTKNVGPKYLNYWLYLTLRVDVEIVQVPAGEHNTCFSISVGLHY
jgi:hypothetical protein